MRFHVRGVDHLCVRGSSVSSKLPEQVFPDATPRPAHKAIIDRCRRSILGRAIAPATAAFQNMHDTADDAAVKRTRCLIPVSGYYEWQNTPSGKQPWYFTARDGCPLLTAAGLWDEWKDRKTGERLKSCTMIITEPNDLVAEIHDRMPALLTEKQFKPWLSGEAGAGILKPAPNDFLQRWPVSKRVNSSKADEDDATLIERVDLAVV